MGSFEPNGFGLYDMLGNVFELTTDLFGRGDAVVVRGGSWQWPLIYSRSAYRGGVARVLQAQTTGLRAARAVQ